MAWRVGSPRALAWRWKLASRSYRSMLRRPAAAALATWFTAITLVDTRQCSVRFCGESPGLVGCLGSVAATGRLSDDGGDRRAPLSREPPRAPAAARPP